MVRANTLTWLRENKRITRLLTSLCAITLLALSAVLSAAIPARGATVEPILYLSNGRDVLRYDGVTGASLGTFIGRSGGGFGAPDLAIGPDGRFYLNDGVQVARYDRTTGATLGTSVDLRSVGFVIAANMAFGPDGNLYVGGQIGASGSLWSKVSRFDGATGAFIDDFVPELFGTQLIIHSMTFGPDGDLYLNCSNSGGTAGYVLRYDGTTGAFDSVFIPSSQLSSFFNGMTFGPDGNLYLPRAGAIVQFSGATGRFISEFVPAGSGGMESPDDLAFGPDGNLYVIQQNNNRVMRFDGKTGKFINVFIAANSDGVIGPKDLLFYPSFTPQPPPRPSKPTATHPADVTLAQQASPNLSVRPNGVVTYTIRAVNRGKGAASNTRITMPFDPANLRVLDATFGRAGAWVSAVHDDSLEIQTGRLAGAGDVVTATVRFIVQPNAVPGAVLGRRLSYRWSDGFQGGAGQSNLLRVTVGSVDSSATVDVLTVEPTHAPAGATHRFGSSVFVPGESVAVWYNTPAGGVVEVGRITADASGVIDLVFDTQGLAPGAYSMVAYGLWTEWTTVGVFQVE